MWFHNAPRDGLAPTRRTAVSLASLLLTASFWVGCDPVPDSTPRESLGTEGEPYAEPVEDPADPGPPLEQVEPERDEAEVGSASTRQAGPEARCDVGAVWQFVEDVRARFPNCEGFPTDAALGSLTCAEVEWAVVESGCIPPARYLTAARLAHGWSADPTPVPATERWEESFCSLYFDADPFGALAPRSGDGPWTAYLRLEKNGDVSCAPTDATCAKSRACRMAGLCVARSTECVAQNDEHCSKSQWCDVLGRCLESEGRCVADKDSCRASAECSRSGACSAVAGECVLRSDEDCRRTRGCTERGMCTLVDGACVAASDEDCQHGACARGLCEAVDLHCRPASTEQCQLHDRGTVFVAGQCVIQSPTNCRSTPDCEAPPVDEDHELDDVDEDLTEQGERKPPTDGRWVKLREGVTWRNFGDGPTLFWPRGGSCKATSACESEGLCAKRGDFCEPTAASCRASRACKEGGRCSLGPENDGHRRCVATSDADCARGKACEEEGHCFFRRPEGDEAYRVCWSKSEIETGCQAPMVAVAGACRLPKGFDCSATSLCKEFGVACEEHVINDCNGQPCERPYVECVEPLDHCATSPECSENGRCATSRAAGLRTLREIENVRAWIVRNGRRDAVFAGVKCEVTDAGCAKSEVCRKRGTCTALEHINTCGVGDPDDCAKSSACREYGACGDHDLSTMSECVPTSVVDCQQSTRCHESGLCTFHGGSQTCVASKDVDEPVEPDDPCAETEGCARFGLCTSDAANGHCIALTRGDCHRADACKLYGRCAPIAGVCRPVAVEHCADSTACEQHGRCELRHSSCRTSDEAAALDALCKSHELCAGADCRASERGAGCDFPSDAACALTEGCAANGECSFVDGECRAAKPSDCEESRACRFGGRCGVLDGRCAATRDEHCAKISRCENGGACFALDGECQSDRPDPDICPLTTGCRERGNCALMGYDYHGVGCMPGWEGDCRQSTRCEELGACSLVEEYPNGGMAYRSCDVASSDDCAGSKLCAREGLCVAIQTEDWGASYSSPPMKCVAVDDAHCAESEACKTEGRCKARRGACVAP